MSEASWQQTPQGQVVECPNCRHPTSLTQEGVPGLQGAFLIHHLFDIQDILKKVNTQANNKCVKCEKRDSTCYCRSCGFLCDSCQETTLGMERVFIPQDSQPGSTDRRRD